MTDWQTRTVENCLSKVHVGSNIKLQTQDYKASGRFPIVDQGQSRIAGWTDDERGVVAEALPYVIFGDHTRVFKFVDFPFVRGADGTQILKPTADIDPLFFFFALRALDLPSRGYNRHFSLLREKEIRIAPDDEQEVIARSLKLVEDAAEVQTREIEALHNLKRATMRALFTKGLRGEALKETDIGMIPESWKPRSIVDLCEIQSGGTPRKSIADYWIGEIPWASGKDLKVPTLHNTADHVSREGAEMGSRIAPADAVLILVRGMGLAKDLPVAVISRPMAFNQDLKALVSRGEFSGTYIRSAVYSAKERLLSRIVPSAHGTMTLNLDDIETFKIPCPSDPAEANEIAEILVALDSKIDLHKRKRDVLDELFKSLLHKLMTSEIHVEDLDLSALDVARFEGSAA